MPILVPPPGLFSTMKVPPVACCSAAAMMRAMMSDGPPGVLATTIRTGRSGKAARAAPMRSTNRAAMIPSANAPDPLTTRRRDGAIAAVLDLSMMCSASARRRADRNRQRADAGDLAFELVAGDGGGDARGGPGHDDIAGGELDHLAELDDHLWHAPDHLREIAVLAHLAVDLERDAALARM